MGVIARIDVFSLLSVTAVCASLGLIGAVLLGLF
jgi:hypothetical protein